MSPTASPRRAGPWPPRVRAPRRADRCAAPGVGVRPVVPRPATSPGSRRSQPRPWPRSRRPPRWSAGSPTGLRTTRWRCCGRRRSRRAGARRPGPRGAGRRAPGSASGRGRPQHRPGEVQRRGKGVVGGQRPPPGAPGRDRHGDRVGRQPDRQVAGPVARRPGDPHDGERAQHEDRGPPGGAARTASTPLSRRRAPSRASGANGSTACQNGPATSDNQPPSNQYTPMIASGATFCPMDRLPVQASAIRAISTISEHHWATIAMARPRPVAGREAWRPRSSAAFDRRGDCGSRGSPGPVRRRRRRPMPRAAGRPPRSLAW